MHAHLLQLQYDTYPFPLINILIYKTTDDEFVTLPEYLEKAKENEYDLILLDVMLPKMDGFEVCQQIREFSDVPIVMVTAKGDDMDKILGLDYGADDYITKPFAIEELVARVKAHIRRENRANNQPNNIIKMQVNRFE